MDKISVVVPCYNEEEALPVYYKEMCRVMDEMKDVVFELIFVDDGSSDATLGIMKDLNEKDSRCRYLSFSRNFGKEAAIYAGLKASEGDYVALMDVDLQDPPALLPEMYEILQEDGYDNVATKRATRTGEPRIRSFLSESFYKFVNAIYRLYDMAHFCPAEMNGVVDLMDLDNCVNDFRKILSKNHDLSLFGFLL